MEKVYFFDFETRVWSHKLCTGGHSTWSFGHAHKRGKFLYAYGTPVPSTEEGNLEVRCTLRQLAPLLKGGKNPHVT